MFIKSIELSFFKGIRNKTFSFSDGKNVVSGKNGSGKTTIATAFYWLLANCDYDLKSNPDIFPDLAEDCCPAVTAVIDVDGTDITIRKTQKRRISEQRDGTRKVALSNTYEINGTPKTERDFKEYLQNRGVNLSLILSLSHPDVFTQQKTGDMRNILFKMASSLSDRDVAKVTSGCENIVSLLETYTMEEIAAMNKASAKKAQEQIEAIPNQIIGLERAKVDIDVAEQELLKNALQLDISNLEKDIAGLHDGDSKKSAIESEIRRLSMKMQEIKDDAEETIHKKRSDWKTRISAERLESVRLNQELKLREFHLNMVNDNIKSHEASVIEEREEYTRLMNSEFDETTLNNIKMEQFDENSLICPTCGQELPREKQLQLVHDIADSKQARIKAEEEKIEQFRKDLDRELENCINRGNLANEKLKEAQEKKITCEKDIASLNLEIEKAASKILALEEEGKAIPQTVDLSGNEEYISLQSMIAEKQKELDSISEPGTYRMEKEAELKEKKQQLASCEAMIAQYQNNIRIDGQIEALRDSLLTYEQTKADSQRILDQLDQISKRKNELLTDEINSHFSIVRWVLFKYLKNGNYDEDCIPQVYDSRKDEWHTIGSSANTALEVMGKVDILNGLQKFYGQQFPIFLDGAECLDDKSKKLVSSDSQMIFLQVSNDDELKVEKISEIQ